MNRLGLLAAVLFGLLVPGSARAEFTISVGSGDFSIANTFNQVTSFQFDIVVDEDLVAGGVYDDPAITSVDYRVFGNLPMATPSGFPGFLLTRSVGGSEFYSLSPDAGLQFSILNSADLSDGLQVSELAGSGVVFEFNARELNQNPGRYHPPILTLNQDGTGVLRNANNDSGSFLNPSSNVPVDVAAGEEYIAGLSFSSSLTVAAVPEPSAVALLGLAAVCFVGRRAGRTRRSRVGSCSAKRCSDTQRRCL
ncbi:MAG: PEP-CTERM sorting domain-containing protein [Planctomycetota bacterium]